MFQGRSLVIATMHQKEKVIAPILEKELGVNCCVDKSLDTDAFGTFSGEVERSLDPVASAREKCRRAMQSTNCDLAVASEGSFGPHPTMFFVPADDEFIVFIDALNEIEIVVREISTATNFQGKYLSSLSELTDFARQVGFPSHGLILRKAPDQNVDIFKGIVDAEKLQSSFEMLYKKYQTVYAETDMRAMYNPTRLRVIASATEKLVEKAKSLCPACQMPGFEVSEARKGLPCERCGSPTNSVLSYGYKCKHCSYAIEERYPNQKVAEDPMYCDFCNP